MKELTEEGFQILISALCERYDCKYEYLKEKSLKNLDLDLEEIILKYFENIRKEDI